ncbi:MAG: enoyl-CoA hydratase-related protein [Myxococcota bacterium]
MSDVVRRERRGAVEIVTVDRAAKLNAIDRDVLEGLDAALVALEGDEAVRAVVLTGAGEKAFVAGADIAQMQSLTAVQAERFAARGQAVLDRLAALPVPTIAAVNGFALGGGCELAMACDLVVAAAKARFGQPEPKLGVIPGFGGTQRLVRRVGLSNALDLCLTARMVGAEEALRMGLCSRVVEGDVLAACVEIGEQIAALGPVAVRLCKRAIHENADLSLQPAQAAERTLFGLCFATDDQKEGMAAFVEGRAPSFSGR